MRVYGFWELDGVLVVATVYKRNSTLRFASNGEGMRSGRSAHTSSKAIAQQLLAQLLDEHRRLDCGGRPCRSYKEAPLQP